MVMVMEPNSGAPAKDFVQTEGPSFGTISVCRKQPGLNIDPPRGCGRHQTRRVKRKSPSYIPEGRSAGTARGESGGTGGGQLLKSPPSHGADKATGAGIYLLGEQMML